MCRVDYADGDGMWLHPLHERRANKQHTCGDCGRTINAGERYTYGAYLGEGHYFGTTKMCAQCVAAGRWLRVVCGGHFWPGVIEELEEHWQEEPELRSVGLGRLILLGKRRGWDREAMRSIHLEWRRRNGELVQIEEINKWVDEALARVPESARH